MFTLELFEKLLREKGIIRLGPKDFLVSPRFFKQLSQKKKDKLFKDGSSVLVMQQPMLSKIRQQTVERLCTNLLEGYADLTDTGVEATRMANTIIEKGLSKWDAWYGTEVTQYYPGLYAGQGDLVGVHGGSDAIGDFKQSNKPKHKDWIEDYLLQLSAYAMAHDQVYGTNINKGVIMMCTPDCYYQEFIIEGSELKKWKHQWLRRVDEYYKNK
jgi:hypothetical protein